MKGIFSPVWELASPKNISFLWGFGSFLGIVMVIQVISGLLLTFFYVSGLEAWESVIVLTREVSSGWILRLIHANMASFVFFVLFIHFFRGMAQSSFYLAYPWISGWIIKVLTMMAAFLGYVLPWGQMSFWGATVIINLLSILPMGKTLVIWLWGGFYVSSYTCSFFFAIHYIVPFAVLAMALVHLLLLHITGSSVPGGLGRSGVMMKFGLFFTYKDVVNMILLWAMVLWMLMYPDWSADPVNFVVSDLSNSPLHIQPEWYFLHFYAILRSIPNKVGGLVGFAMALVALVFLVFVFSYWSLSQFYQYNYVMWTFFSSNVLLLWLGMQPVEDPFIFMGQVMTTVYFALLMLMLAMDLSSYKVF